MTLLKRNKLKKITQLLSEVNIPYVNITLGQAIKKGQLTLKLNDNNLFINLSFCLHENGINKLNNSCQQTLQPIFNQIACTTIINILARKPQNSLKPIKGITNIIAVCAGKGGVGKSTVALNSAVALAQAGARVGLLDADIYGPNIPQMIGHEFKDNELKSNNNLFEPIERYGVKTMSIGYLIDPSHAAIWRGPMITKALTQLLWQTQWGTLDYLIIDMPPGTGDIPLTLAQKIPVAAAIVVATPQALALGDIEKNIAMLNKTNITLLGIVENMCMYTCEKCNHKQPIFSHANADAICAKHKCKQLAQLPLDPLLDHASLNGIPITHSKPDAPSSTAFAQLAYTISLECASLERDYSVQFNNIDVTQTQE